MSLFIKICGITDVATARAAVDAGADAIGLVPVESPRKVSVTMARRIVAALPQHCEVFLVVRNLSNAAIRGLLAEVQVDALQLHCAGAHLPHADFGVELVPAIPADCSAPPAGICRFVVDSPAGAGSGRAWDFAAAPQAPPGQRMILAGGLRPDNVQQAIAKAWPWGVDVSSGVEKKRGVKDVGLIRDFIKQARQE